jgi:HD superfamily phosphohydrolase
MFLGVYLHHASVGYETLLQRFCDTSDGEYALPFDIDEYLQHDDVALLSALRRSKNPWARRIVRRQGYRMVIERGPNDRAAGGTEEAQDLARFTQLKELLDSEGIDAFVTSSRGVLSTYGKDQTLWVVTPQGEVPIADYTPLYQRYAEAAALVRLYVVPEREAEARVLLGLPA